MSELMPLAEELSQVYARISGLLLSEETVQTALDLVTSQAVDTISGAVGAGVTLIDTEGAKHSAGATSDLVARADDLQYELCEGPCLTACDQRMVVRVNDFALEERWPRWRRVALPLGLRSSLSAPLITQDKILGAIKIYGQEPMTFSAESEALLTRLAAQAAILLANVTSLEQAERLSASLQAALRARNVIALADGILMERHGLTEEQAFLEVIAAARRNEQGLADEATSIIESTPRESA